MHDKGTFTAPFIKTILPVAAGLTLSAYLNVNYVATTILCVAALSAALVFRKRAAGSTLAWCGILLFFFSASEAATPQSHLPAGEHIRAVAQIREITSIRGRWQHATADVGYYKLSKEPMAEWRKADESIQLSIDTCYDVRPGMQMAFCGWLNPIDTTGSSYGNLMKLRGYHHRLYLTPGNLLKETRYTSTTPAYYASRLHDKALGRLDRLTLSNKSRAIVSAMVTGDRRSIDRDLRRDYNRSGGAHLLAVSGLHVGIIFILINTLLYLLPAFRHGHIIKNTLAVVCIWLYATTAGLAPSVIRAALMFSFAQLALASSSQRNALNVLLGSALVMLAINPNYATDPGFLLSYTAVLSIFMFYGPMSDLMRTRYKPVNSVSGIVAIGLAATIGTAPLVSHIFGNFSFISVIINPVAILTAHVIVLFGVIWIVAPLSTLQPLFSATIEFAAKIQNAVIEWSAAQTWAIHEGNLPAYGVFLCYAMITISLVSIYNSMRYKNNHKNHTGYCEKQHTFI